VKILQNIQHSLYGLYRGEHFGIEGILFVQEKIMVVIDLIAKKCTSRYFGPSFLIKAKVVDRGRGEQYLLGMWQPVHAPEPKSMQLQPVIVHPLGGAISLVRYFRGHFALTFPGAGYNGP